MKSMKTHFTIFYSWQSDIPASHKFIQSCIDKAVKELNRKKSLEFDVQINIDRDTKNTSGSPAITSTILDKIDNADIFVADVTLINNMFINRFLGKRLTPNPNVLIELGYAIKALGWDRIICINNLNLGANEQLPFDIRGHRISTFKSLSDKEKSSLTSTLSVAIKSIVDSYPAIIKKRKTQLFKNHDEEIFRQIQELLTERQLEEDLNVVVGSLHYKASDTARWIKFIRFYDNTLNHFTNPEVDKAFSALTKQVEAFKNQVIIKINKQVNKGKRLYEYQEPITDEIRHEVDENTWFFVSKDPWFGESWIEADQRIAGYGRELNQAADDALSSYREFLKVYKSNILLG
jgi:hypothetical protein